MLGSGHPVGVLGWDNPLNFYLQNAVGRVVLELSLAIIVTIPAEYDSRGVFTSFMGSTS
jgi:hypothetical protein